MPRRAKTEKKDVTSKDLQYGQSTAKRNLRSNAVREVTQTKSKQSGSIVKEDEPEKKVAKKPRRKAKGTTADDWKAPVIDEVKKLTKKPKAAGAKRLPKASAASRKTGELESILECSSKFESGEENSTNIDKTEEVESTTESVSSKNKVQTERSHSARSVSKGKENKSRNEKVGIGSTSRKTKRQNDKQVSGSESKLITSVSESKPDTAGAEKILETMNSKLEIAEFESKVEANGNKNKPDCSTEVCDEQMTEATTEGDEPLAGSESFTEKSDDSADENSANLTYTLPSDVTESVSKQQEQKPLSPRKKTPKCRRTYFVSCFNSDNEQQKQSLKTEVNFTEMELMAEAAKSDVGDIKETKDILSADGVSLATDINQQQCLNPEQSTSHDVDRKPKVKGEFEEIPSQPNQQKRLTDKAVMMNKLKRQHGNSGRVENDTNEQYPKKKIRANNKIKDGSKKRCPTKKMPLADLDLKMKMLKKTQTKNNKYIGAHVSISGSLCNAISDAVSLGARAFGMFLKSQRQWSSKPLDKEDAEIFKTYLQECGFSPSMVVPHGSYLMNCGSPDSENLAKSRAMLTDELRRCNMLGLDIFNFHPGSTCGEISREESISLIAESINMALEETKNVTAVIENMCCQGHTIGGKFSELAEIIDKVKDKSRIGVCLDTCHMFAAGYDIRSKDDYENVMMEFDDVVGFKYLKAVHLNDSQGKLGSHRDLHANIDAGEIGVKAFKHIMNDPRFDNIPMILETPQSDYSKEIKLLNTLMDP